MISAAHRARLPFEDGPATPALIGRFIVPPDRRSIRFVVENLYVAHTLRERLLWPVHRWTGGQWLAASASGDAPAEIGSSAADPELISEVLHTVLPKGEPATWIYERDYPLSSRGRSLLFLFAGARHRPVAVIKCGVATTATPLGRERDVLLDLRTRLPGQLASTVPEPLIYRAVSGREVLALAFLPGRCVYAELHTTLRPGAGIRDHMQAAAVWLARFHDATARDAPFVPGAPAGAGEVDAAWLDDLRGRCARRPLTLVTSHGDFWARNLLMARRGGAAEATGVVDWEHCREAAAPFDDLLHFAASYGLNFPWRRYRRLPPDTALRLTFLARTTLSTEVRRCFLRYCDLRGIDFALVDPLLRLYVLDRAQNDSPQRESWCRFHETLARADRSVFSG